MLILLLCALCSTPKLIGALDPFDSPESAIIPTPTTEFQPITKFSSPTPTPKSESFLGLKWNTPQPTDSSFFIVTEPESTDLRKRMGPLAETFYLFILHQSRADLTTFLSGAQSPDRWMDELSMWEREPGNYIGKVGKKLSAFAIEVCGQRCMSLTTKYLLSATLMDIQLTPDMIKGACCPAPNELIENIDMSIIQEIARRKGIL